MWRTDSERRPDDACHAAALGYPIEPGYTVRRDRVGWHTYRPDRTEIGPDLPRVQ